MAKLRRGDPYIPFSLPFCGSQHTLALASEPSAVSTGIEPSNFRHISCFGGAPRILLGFVLFDGPLNTLDSREKHSLYMQVRPIDSVHSFRLQLIGCLSILRSIAVLGALLAGTYGLAKGKGRAISTVFAASAAVNSGLASATFFSASLFLVSRQIFG